MANFQVGEWTVEPDTGRLSHGSVRVNLQPQVMQLLVFLANNPKEVISIDTMIAKVWHGKPMTSGSVYNSLNILRKAFDDDPHDPRYIETIPKKGYRLIAAVEFDTDQNEALKAASVINGSADSLEYQRSIAGTTNDRYSSQTLKAGIAALLLLVGVYFMWSSYLEPPATVLSEITDMVYSEFSIRDPSDLVTDPKSIAVLPFADLSANGDQQYFADGISEEILNVIARHADLKVVGRTSSFQFRDAEADLKEIGNILNVAHILEGSVRRDGDQLRVTAQLIKVSNGFHVWSETYDAQSGAVFVIQDEIAGKITRSLEATLLSSDAAEPSASLELYELVLLARHRIHRGSEQDLLEAIKFLRQAIEIDPGFARAYVELAWAYRALSQYPAAEGLGEKYKGGPVVFYAQMALDLDPNLADAHAALGMENYIRAWNGVGLPESSIESEKSFARAFELNPNLSRALMWYSGLKRFQGASYVESIKLARKGVELEPLWLFAASHYLGLIKDIPSYRAERWALIRQSKSQQGYDSNTYDKNNEAEMLLAEGRIAETISFLEASRPFEENDYMGKTLSFTAQSYIGNFLPDYSSMADPISWRLWALFPDLFDSLSQDCPFDSRMLKHTHAISVCTYVLLLTGQTARAYEYLQAYAPEDINQFDMKFSHTFFGLSSIGVTAATVHSLRNEVEKAKVYIDLTEKLLASVTDDYTLETVWAARTRAYLHALRGEHEQTIEQLSYVINHGDRDFRVFMHPAFSGLHQEPAYIALLETWMGLINEERLKLGLEPKELNYDVGPGVIPFKLDPIPTP